MLKMMNAIALLIVAISLLSWLEAKREAYQQDVRTCMQFKTQAECEMRGLIK